MKKTVKDQQHSCQKIQKKLIENYHKVKKTTSLRAMSTETDIQVTRLHRIMHGSEMKLGEFLKFQQVIKDSHVKGSWDQELYDLMSECLDRLPPLLLEEIKLIMKKKIGRLSLI